MSSGGSTGKRIGKYDVQATLGMSPRARVYRGLDSETQKPVALKVIGRAHLNAAALPAYRKYGEALARLDHPSVAKFVDLIENDKAVCVVSELAEGVPLSTLLKDGAHPDMKMSWEIARQLLEAIAFAHARGAVHRDLKPSNVLLAPDGTLKVVDFGVAALLAGTPETIAYRAPEQFQGGTITARTDIYNAGAIIYQLVTGRLPFTGTPEEIEHRVFQERPSDPSSYNNKIAWQLDWVIQKALSKDAIERFLAATDFAEGLRLGMQDTIGRPLDPIAAPQAASAPAAPPAPKPAPTPVREPTKPPVAAGPARPTAAAGAPAAARAPSATSTAPAEPAQAKPAAPLAPAQAGAQSPKPAAAPNLAQKAAALAKSAAPAAPAAAAPAKAAALKPRILFVDDDERILNAVRTLFRQEYEVTTAEGGEAALEAIKQFDFHVIVSDQRMPGVTGVELLRQARTIAPNAVRMLLTGYTDLAALVGSINQGEIFKFVMKPWDNEDLKKAIAEAVRIGLELAATPPSASTGDKPPETHPRSAGSILVIDPKEGLAKGIERLLSGAASVMLVKSPHEAAKVLQSREIACIVADLGAGTDGLVALFKQIKEKRPAVLSILLAEEPDSELGIELINKAQIYRFLPKPVSAKELRTQVAAALRRYAAIKSLPPGAANAMASSAAVERARATPDRPAPGRV